MQRLLPLFLAGSLLFGTSLGAQSPPTRNATTSTDSVSAWLTANASPLRSVNAETGFADLQPLRAIVGDARIVLLGEPTHGNREVYQLKHRMVEFLVQEMGFNVFALETPMPESFDVDAYVSRGVGTPERALAAAHVWPWDTEAVAEMLGWMRRRNTTADKPLTFYGFDMQSSERAAVRTLAYLDRVDPSLATVARAAFGHLAISFTDPEAGGYRPTVSRDFDATVEQAVADVRARFDQHRATWTEATSPDAWSVARQHAQVLQRWVQANVDGDHYDNLRDSSMAENIAWIREREGPDAKIIVWAHNRHVANEMGADSVSTLGHQLRNRYGSEVVIVGALFGEGEFLALETGAASRGLWPFRIGAPPAGTVEAGFADAGLELAMVDLRRLPAQGAVAEWFHRPQPTFSTGGTYNVDNPQRYGHPYVPAGAFDALMYVHTTTATRPVEPADQGTFPILATPVNLGFEHGVLGEAPPGWLAWSKLRRFGFEVVTTNDRPFHGRRAVVVRRDAADVIGEASGSVLQRIDASAYRGQRIRLRAAVRAELPTDALAFLRLRVHDLEEVDHDMPELYYDSLDEYRVTAPTWRVLQIEADVPMGAEMISYGLFLAGSGAVWLDDVALEVVDVGEQP